MPEGKIDNKVGIINKARKKLLAFKGKQTIDT